MTLATNGKDVIRLDITTGQWVPATGDDLAAEGVDPITAGVKGAVRAAKDTYSIAETALGFAMDLAGDPNAQIFKDRARERFEETGRESEAFGREAPISSALGENLDLLAGGASLLRGGLTRSATSQLKRTEGRLASQIREVRGGFVGKRADMVAKTSGLSHFTTEPFIHHYNRKLVNSAVASRIGGEGVERLLKETGGAITAEVRQAISGGALARMLRGVPDDVVIDSRAYADDFVRDRVRKLGADKDFMEFAEPEDLQLFEQGVWTGEEFRRLRSELGKMQQQAGKAGMAKKREYIEKTIERLDDIAEQAEGVNLELYREGRQAYRLWKALTRQKAAIGDEGFINPKSFQTGMRSTYGEAYKQGRYDEFGPETADIMRMIDRAVEAGVEGAPDSGTAQRLFNTAVTTGVLGSIVN